VAPSKTAGAVEIDVATGRDARTGRESPPPMIETA